MCCCWVRKKKRKKAGEPPRSAPLPEGGGRSLPPEVPAPGARHPGGARCVCRGPAEPNQGRQPAVSRQGCERRLLSPSYTSPAGRSRRTPPLPLAPAAPDSPPAAVPRPGPMRGTASRFGPSLLRLHTPPFPSSSPPFSGFLPGSPASPPAAAPGWGEPGEGGGQTSDAGAWSPYLPEPYLPVISQEGETRSVPACEGAACGFRVGVPAGIWGAPRRAESGGASPPASLLLSLLCDPFRFLPLLPEPGHRGLSGRPAPGCDRSPRRPRRRGWLRDGCRSPKRVLGPGAGTVPRGGRSPRPRPVRVSRPPFSPPPLSVTLGWKPANERGDARKKLTSLSGEVTFTGSPC